MSSEDLLVGRHDATGVLEGAGALDALADTGRALADGDWVEAGVMGVASGLEGLSAVADPVAALTSAGVGFALEHLQPLAGWFDDLAGDPDQIHAFASSWRRVADLVRDTGDDYLLAALRTTAPWDGQLVGAYRAIACGQSALIHGFGTGVRGVAGAVEAAGAIVAGVRELVRDALAQVVGFAVARSVELLSGVLTAKAIVQIARKVAEWTSRMSAFLRSLVRSVEALGGLLGDLVRAARAASSGVTALADRWAATTIASQRYDFDLIRSGRAAPGAGLPSLANLGYLGLGGATEHTLGLDDRAR